MVLRPLALATLCLGLVPLAQADSIKIDHAWVRATAPGQPVAGGFLDLTADADMKLLGGSSAVSSTLELHTMKVENGVMLMRQVKEIALPKGKTVQLRPGGLHIMFIGLKQQIKEGDKVPVSLNVQDAAGKTQVLSVEIQAKRSGEMGGMGEMGAARHHPHH